MGCAAEDICQVWLAVSKHITHTYALCFYSTSISLIGSQEKNVRGDVLTPALATLIQTGTNVQCRNNKQEIKIPNVFSSPNSVWFNILQ